MRRFDAEEIKAWSAARRLSRAIAAALDGFKREDIAIGLSEQLGETVSKATLDAYASPEKPHAIPAHRLAALYAVTGDERLLNALLNEVGLIAVPAKYEALLKRERARELKERAEREEQAADAEWKARR
ncbi:MAG TPA: phage regulatory CII family protein [Rhodopseudomonas sp.]|uniref:phage regulatory CII family protein n=1 Tax=Rhodopseudomonas sp. TaxID=1078 RepID=UPI002ED8FEB0